MQKSHKKGIRQNRLVKPTNIDVKTLCLCVCVRARVVWLFLLSKVFSQILSNQSIIP